MDQRRVNIEGFTPEDLLSVGDDLEAIAFNGEPVVFQAGTAEVLASFRTVDAVLVAELAHIDGGGEGVLPTLSLILKRYGQLRGMSAIEWRVHATRCARPNLKLRRVLENRGFEVTTLEGSGEVYYFREEIGARGSGSG